MKSLIPQFNPRYLYDEAGNKRGVLIKAKEFEKIIEQLEELYDLEEIKDIEKKPQKARSLEAIMAEREKRKK